MPLVKFNWSPEPRVLRQFGWVACAVGLLLAIFAWEGWAAWVAGAAGVFSGLASFVQPSLNRPLFVALSVITYPIGFVMSIVVLVVLFYVVVAPVGILLRLFGADPLLRRLDPRSASYWTAARPERPKEDYFRQY
jgi:hypothetical protein